MKNKAVSVILKATFVFYILLMLQLLFRFNPLYFSSFSFNNIVRNYNLIPFHTIKGYWSGSFGVSLYEATVNLFGNIFVFTPLGLYFQTFYSKKLLRNILLMLFIPIAVELLQFTFGVGALDIDDVILNFTGGMLGILIYKMLSLFMKNSGKVKTVIAMAALLVALPALVIVVGTIITMVI